MQTGISSIDTSLPTSPSVVKVLTDCWGQAPRQAWHALRHHLRRTLGAHIPSKSGRSFTVTLHSHTDAIESTVRDIQRRLTQQYQQSQTWVDNVGLCLRESLANAIIHGNLEIPTKLRDDSWHEFEQLLHERQNLSPLVQRQVVVRCEIKPRFVKFDIEDQGPGFDAESVAGRLQRHVLATDADNLDALSAGGRGLVIITTFMDHVFWNPTGNCITMIKQIPASEE